MVTERVCLSYENNCSKYANKNKDYTKQYCKIYLYRLNKMSELLTEAIENKWKGEFPICQLYKLSSEEENKKYIVIGTIFKDQKLKHSVLKELSEANQLVPQPILTHFTDASDVLFIEDELQRYQLQGLDGQKLVTGITCALLVDNFGSGKLIVHDYCFAECRKQIERPIFHEDNFIVFMGGLDLVHMQNVMLQLQLFTNWIYGALGDINDIPVAKVSRIVIVGNSVKNELEKPKLTLSLTSRTPLANDSIEAVKVLDALLDKWCDVIDVDIMPGENDPTNRIIPQQPLHKCMLPNASLYNSLHLVTNPYECNVGGLQILGTSGQPVTNIMQYCEISEPLDVLESCLKWNHIAPTAPDTLGCYPYYDNDPFILETCPHVFFAGNQDHFDTRLYKGPNNQSVRLLTIPKFTSTHTVALLNMKNLDCIPMSFRI